MKLASSPFVAGLEAALWASELTEVASRNPQAMASRREEVEWFISGGPEAGGLRAARQFGLRMLWMKLTQPSSGGQPHIFCMDRKTNL